MIAIIDYGMGNLGAIHNMFKKIGVESVITSGVSEISKAGKLVLPGVGAFDEGMKNLEKHGLTALLEKKVLEEKTPILGICLGAQLFTKSSEEGELGLPGLGWIDAKTVKFDFDASSGLKIPHMGWNAVKPVREDVLFHAMDPEMRFYFVHSYYLSCHQKEDILGESFYGFNFASAVRRGNIAGVQFHPEKSHKFGMQLFKNFSNE